MAAATRIDAAEILRVAMSDDGSSFTVRLRDGGGATASVTIPVCRLGEILAGLPLRFDAAQFGAADALPATHAVASWSLQSGSGPHELVLTLSTREGRVASFGVTAGQLAAMATLVSYGAFGTGSRPLLN